MRRSQIFPWVSLDHKTVSVGLDNFFSERLQSRMILVSRTVAALGNDNFHEIADCFRKTGLMLGGPKAIPSPNPWQVATLLFVA